MSIYEGLDGLDWMGIYEGLDGQGGMGVYEGLDGQGWMGVYVKDWMDRVGWEYMKDCRVGWIGLDEGIFEGFNGQGLDGYI